MTEYCNFYPLNVLQISFLFIPAPCLFAQLKGSLVEQCITLGIDFFRSSCIPSGMQHVLSRIFLSLTLTFILKQPSRSRALQSTFNQVETITRLTYEI